MSDQTTVTYSTIDANEAVASVAYRFSEVIAIYPITPSSPMGESAESWAAVNRKNLWGTVPSVVEMQSEGGAAGTVHGALQTGALATTFTASQGLLLMIPNMFKIAGELTPAVFHVAARSLAYQALSIFGDHSDVMSARSCGWAMLCGSSTQEAADFAAISHAATLESRIPFINFFDGFRTSHEIGKIADITDDTLNGMIKQEWLDSFRERALTPDAPVLRGTAQNPDVYFQGRETVNRFYEATPAIVQNAMDKFAELTGRSYHLVDYTGAPDAERVIILMGSGAEAVEETVEAMIARENARWACSRCACSAPSRRGTDQGAPPRWEDALTAPRNPAPRRTAPPGRLRPLTPRAPARSLHQRHAQGGGGCYGLSQGFTPAMVKGVYDNLEHAPKNHFTIGINDDVLGTSIPYDEDYSTEADDVTRMFFGLGSDGTVGANKDAIKIIGQHTDLYVQGYFVYDSKKAGSSTISHLRFGPRPIRSTYLITKANFLAPHQPTLLNLFDFLKNAANGATFLMPSPHPADKLWDTLPARVKRRFWTRTSSLHD
ncbi:MAG: 2-oxoacid:acceptor oxidoreductase family protein [Akkermansia sp.]